MRNVGILTIALASTVALSGCIVPGPAGYAPPNTGYQQPQQQSNVQYGVVTSVRPVAVQVGSQGQPPVGALLGAIAGGVLGNTMGKGNGHIVGAVAGAALGGLAGNAVQQQTEANYAKAGLEITVRLNNGASVTVSQADDQRFNPGDRVAVIQNPDGSSTVSH